METANDAEWLLSEDKTKLSFSLEVSSAGKTVRYEDEFPVTLPNRLRIIHADRLVSHCTQFPESRLFVFNPLPGFDCIFTARKSRTVAHKTRTK
jgi:hypothetical protein